MFAGYCSEIVIHLMVEMKCETCSLLTNIDMVFFFSSMRHLLWILFAFVQRIYYLLSKVYAMERTIEQVVCVTFFLSFEFQYNEFDIIPMQSSFASRALILLLRKNGTCIVSIMSKCYHGLIK